MDRNMVYDMHDGDYTVTVGTSSIDTIDTAEIKVRDKQNGEIVDMSMF